MTNGQTRQAFLKSEKASLLRDELEKMVRSPMYNTKLYSLIDDPDKFRFVEKHMNYMSGHPSMDHMQYVANLKLMTKVTKK